MRIRTLVSLVLFASVGLGSSASAHDLLVDIDPKEGSVVAASYFEARLTFNNPLLVVADEVNAELAIRLKGSENWTNQEISIEGSELLAQVVLNEPGEYELRWKVVSSDGHPITGESSFAAEFESSPEPLEPEVIAPNPISETETETGSLTGFYIGLAMVALGAVFAPIGLMMRRKAKRPRA